MKFKSAPLQILSIISCLTLFFSDIQAQDTTKVNHQVEIKSLNKVKAYLFGFGVEREQKITNSSTIYFGATIESVVPFFPDRKDNKTDVFKLDYSINIAPTMIIGFKNYYNLSKRAKIGKKIIYNSASFFGMEYNLIAPILINKNQTTNYVHSFSPTWGFQNNVLKHTNIEFEIGPSLQTDLSNTRVSGFAKIGFNFLL